MIIIYYVQIKIFFDHIYFNLLGKLYSGQECLRGKGKFRGDRAPVANVEII